MSKQAHSRRTWESEPKHRLGRPAAPASAGRIALVDDDPFFRRSMQRLLGTMGFEVASYSSAEEFLAYPQKNRFSCLLVDFHLPGMTGMELFERLGRDGVHSPVILLSTDPEVGRCARERAAGAVWFLSKPVDANVLAAALAAAATQLVPAG